MRELLLGVVLIVLLGIGGFFYRNAMEGQPPGPVACTMEAKVCPDGSAVGREGPRCEFAPCPFPNVENANLGVSFVSPLGYRLLDSGTYIRLTKPSVSGEPLHTITVSVLPIQEGETADDVILANTRYQPADMAAEDFSRFDMPQIGGRQWRSVVIERFEAVVQSAYYLPRANDVLFVSITEHDVVDWMEPNLVVEDLPEHAALIRMLETLQTNN